MKLQKTLVATFVALAFSATAFAQTAEEIVAKHITARGGADKLAAVKTLIVDNSMAVQGMDIPMVITTVRGVGMRSEITVMGNEMLNVSKVGSGWNLVPAMMSGSGSAEDLPAEQAKNITAADLDPFAPLGSYKESGAKLELVGTEKVNGKDAYNLKLTKNGTSSNVYIDVTSMMMVKTKGPGMGGPDQEIIMSDFKAVDGILFPFAMTTQSPMGGEMTITCNKVLINTNVDAKIFEKPAK
jgi:hypothetical protein